MNLEKFSWELGRELMGPGQQKEVLTYVPEKYTLTMRTFNHSDCDPTSVCFMAWWAAHIFLYRSSFKLIHLHSPDNIKYG